MITPVAERRPSPDRARAGAGPRGAKSYGITGRLKREQPATPAAGAGRPRLSRKSTGPVTFRQKFHGLSPLAASCPMYLVLFSKRPKLDGFRLQGNPRSWFLSLESSSTIPVGHRSRSKKTTNSNDVVGWACQVSERAVARCRRPSPQRARVSSPVARCAGCRVSCLLPSCGRPVLRLPPLRQGKLWSRFRAGERCCSER